MLAGGRQRLRRMTEYNPSVTMQDTFSIKRLDVDYFDPDA